MSPSRVLSALVLAAAVAVPLAAQAQSAPAPVAGARAHHHNPFMHALRTLGLTDAQKQQIKALAASTKTANENADPATRKANRAKLQADVRALLTPDQQSKLQAEIDREKAQAPKER